MADKAVPFFNPSDLLSLGGDWVIQEDGLSNSKQRAQGLGATGDEAASKTYDAKEAGTLVFENHAATGNLTLPNVGSVAGGYHIDSMSLAYSATGWPKLSLAVHQHADNPHATGLKEYAASITFPAGFGVPRNIGTDFVLGDTDAGLRSMTYTLACTHVDENDEVGDHLAGENRDGVETLAAEFTKDPTTVTIAAGWDEMTDGYSKANTAAETASMSWEHHVAAEA